MSQILILGGGSAGIMVAARLRNELSMDEASITIVDPSDKHYYQAGFTLVALGLDEPEYLVRPMEKVVPAGCTFIQDEVANIIPDSNYVETKGGKRLEYDHLILATGTKLSFSEVEGLTENLGKDGVHTFYTLDGAIALRKVIDDFEEGNFVVAQPPMPFKCPGAPIKMALMVDDIFRRKGIRNKANVTLTTALPSVFSREPYATKLNQLFESRNIGVVPGFNPAKVDVENRVIKSWEGKEVPYDVGVVIPPNEGEAFYEDMPIVDASNFVKADKHRLVQESFDNIYAIGDCANYPTSKTASGARKQAEVLSNNLVAKLRGREPRHTYSGHII